MEDDLPAQLQCFEHRPSRPDTTSQQDVFCVAVDSNECIRHLSTVGHIQSESKLEKENT